MKISIRKSAIKDLKSIGKPFKKNIEEKILELIYRMSVENYRVLFDIVEENLIVARVTHRQSSYK